MRTVLAGDLGGTKCRFALVDAELSVHAVIQIPTVREQATFLTEFDAALDRVLAERPSHLEPPTAAGFGVAGVIPPDGSRVRDATNLPFDDFPLAAHVEQRLGLPTTLINDGRASAWGEYLRGHARGKDPLLCLFFGTGIGIGVIVDGVPYRGGSNAAGEIGHTTYIPGGRRCPCGRRGHFEAYCGGRAITEWAAEVLGRAPGTADGRWTVGALVAAAEHEDGAQQILEEAATAACVLVENLCTALDPNAIVLGGGVLAGWPALHGRIESYVREATRAVIHEDLTFVPSLGGSDAILQGAAWATGCLSRS
ncbi:MAG: ROK family protein [bacterium]|nr:ROK family protein [bacterium]